MVTSVGYKYGKNKLVTGFGTVHHHPRRHYGSGIVRKAASAGTRALGTYLVNRLADIIEGSGHRRHIVHAVHSRRPVVHRR